MLKGTNKIGVFDSGLGGLVIAKAIIKKLPQYDYIYFGDTKNLPYGEKTQKEIFEFTTKALKYLFVQGCSLVIIACNTSSAKALRKIQREFLPKNFPDKKVLGVIVPTIETLAMKSSASAAIGVLATSSTVNTHAYKREIKKINPKIKVFEQPAAKLVPMIENDTLELVDFQLEQYISKLLKNMISALVLGCTHYPILKKNIQKLVGKKIKVISQEDIIPAKLALYLKKHAKITKQLTKNGSQTYFVSKINPDFEKVANRLFGKKIALKQVDLNR
jgi:glutamate racemase